MKRKLMTFITTIALVTACNNNGQEKTANDSAGAAIDDNAAPKNNTSAQDYSGMADTLRMTTEAGNYLDPTIDNKKGKKDSIKK